MAQPFSFDFASEDIEEDEQDGKDSERILSGALEVDADMDVEANAGLVKPMLRTLEEMVGFYHVAFIAVYRASWNSNNFRLGGCCFRRSVNNRL